MINSETSKLCRLTTRLKINWNNACERKESKFNQKFWRELDHRLYEPLDISKAFGPYTFNINWVGIEKLIQAWIIKDRFGGLDTQLSRFCQWPKHSIQSKHSFGGIRDLQCNAMNFHYTNSVNLLEWKKLQAFPFKSREHSRIDQGRLLNNTSTQAVKEESHAINGQGRRTHKDK